MRSHRLMPGWVEGSDGLRRAIREFPGHAIEIHVRDQRNQLVRVERVSVERGQSVVETLVPDPNRLSPIEVTHE